MMNRWLSVFFVFAMVVQAPRAVKHFRSDAICPRPDSVLVQREGWIACKQGALQIGRAISGPVLDSNEDEETNTALSPNKRDNNDKNAGNQGECNSSESLFTLCETAVNPLSEPVSGCNSLGDRPNLSAAVLGTENAFMQQDPNLLDNLYFNDQDPPVYVPPKPLEGGNDFDSDPHIGTVTEIAKSIEITRSVADLDSEVSRKVHTVTNTDSVSVVDFTASAGVVDLKSANGIVVRSGRHISEIMKGSDDTQMVFDTLSFIRGFANISIVSFELDVFALTCSNASKFVETFGVLFENQAVPFSFSFICYIFAEPVFECFLLNHFARYENKHVAPGVMESALYLRSSSSHVWSNNALSLFESIEYGALFLLFLVIFEFGYVDLNRLQRFALVVR